MGVVLGFSMGLLLADAEVGDSWRKMCLVGMIFPVTMIFLTVGVLPETPRWFVLNGLDDDAREVLADIYPQGTIRVHVRCSGKAKLRLASDLTVCDLFLERF